MKTIILCITVFMGLVATSSFAGLGYYEKKIHKFQYEVEGEIIVKPNRAVIPVIINTSDISFEKSLIKARKILFSTAAGLKKLDSKNFSLSPADFFKPINKGKKILDVSFFGGEKNLKKTKLILYVNINFNDDHDFWARAELLSKAHDYLSKLKKNNNSKDDSSIYIEETFYEISDAEKYRAQIIESIYQKAKVTASIIENKEKIALEIKHITFDQHINKDIVNFNSASLTINANIEFGKEDKSDK